MNTNRIKQAWRMKQMTYEDGFTLIEILVVVALIAILAMMTLMIINPSKQRGKLYDVKRKRDLNQLKGVYELFYAKNLRFPKGEEVCYDSPVPSGAGACSCHVCGLEQDVGTFRDVLQVLYCDPEHSRKTYVYEYDCTDNPDWFKMYAKLSANDSSGSSCSYGVTNRPDEFLEPYPNTCGTGEPSGGGGNGNGGPTPTPPPACPVDPAPKYCRLGGICNICGSLSNCLLPSSCDQPTVLFNDSLCTNKCL